MNIKIAFITLSMGLLTFAACNNHGENSAHQHASHEGLDHDSKETIEGHDHDPANEHAGHNHGEAEAISYNKINGDYELFVEYSPLVVTKKASFLVHLTKLENYKPVTSGEVTITLNSSAAISSEPTKNLRNGIFKPTLLPLSAGKSNLTISWKDGSETVSFKIEDVAVYQTEDDAFHAQAKHEEEELIPFLKEQAWETEFGIAEAKEHPYSEIIKTTGEILPAQGDEQIITARHRGTVLFNTNQLLSGKRVRKNEQLMSLNASLLDGNLNQDFVKAKAAFQKAEQTYLRAKSLIKERLITQSAFSEAEASYQSTKAIYDNISQFYTAKGERIVSPVQGYIKSCLVSEGEFVEAGRALAVITQNKRLTLRADVPQKDYGRLAGVFSANFTTPYDNLAYNIEDLNGRKISFGKTTLDNTFFTPVYFEIDNSSKLIPGSYVEVFLKTGKRESALTVPLSALLEEQGAFYLFVQDEGEAYRKVYVTPGHSDGKNIEILRGLSAGDIVVIRGAYQVKMAASTGEAPAHAHSH